MFSYLIQAITTLLFGPIWANFVVVFELEIAKPSGFSAKLYEAATNLAYSVAKTNIFVSLSVEIASIIRIVQAPPVAEFSFILVLGFLEVFIVWGALISLLSYHRVLETGIIAFGCYALAVLALSTASFFKGGLPSSQSEILETLTIYCVIERDYPIPILALEQDTPGRGAELFLGIYTASYIALGIVGIVIWHYFKRKIIAMWAKLKKIFLALCRYLRIKPRYPFYCVGAILLTTYWGVAVTLLMIVLKNSREQLKRASGPLYQDSQWGFGQIAALVAWAPVLHDIIFEIGGASPSSSGGLSTDMASSVVEKRER